MNSHEHFDTNKLVRAKPRDFVLHGSSAMRVKSAAKDCAYSMHMALSAADAGLTEAYRSASRLYVRAVNLPAGLPPLGGATGTRALWGQSGTGRTRAVDGEEEEPVSRFCCMSTAATSHFRQLPTSSAVGVYDVPFPTCKMPSNACDFKKVCKPFACIGTREQAAKYADLDPGLAAACDSLATPAQI